MGIGLVIKVLIYTLIAIIITAFCIIRKLNVLGILLWSIYSIIGIFSCICIKKGWYAQYLNTDILPYFFLLLVYSISFFPYLNKERFTELKFEKTLPLQYYWFSNVYIVTATVMIVLYINPVRHLIVSGRWFDNIGDVYTGNIVFPYRNRIEYLCIQFTGYTRLLALIVGFALQRYRQDFVRGILMAATAMISGILSGLYISSRGTLVNIVLIAVAIYLFFHKQYEGNYRIRIATLLSLLIIVLVPLFSAITISRFSNQEGVKSILQYLGQAPLIFSGGVSGITRYSYGVYGFGTLMNQKISQASVGGNWRSGFYTYVGWLFIDWGPVGTVIIVLAISTIIYLNMQKEEYTLSDLYFIFFVYYTLLQGVFVIGSSYCYQIVVAIVLYFFLKMFFDNKEYYIGVDYKDSKSMHNRQDHCKYIK